MRRWGLLAALTFVALAVTLRLDTRSRPSAVALNALAPELALHDLQDKPLDLKQLRGRVVAVNFWATWCAPCLQEIPELARLWREQRDRCFDVVGVATGSQKSEVAQAAANIPYPVVFDAQGSVARGWGVESLPQTFIVDAEGKVRGIFAGAITRHDLIEATRELLPQACASL